MAPKKIKLTETIKKPAEILEGAVRTVGIFKPKFNPNNGKVFSDELVVLGTAFWLKEYKVLITCAHVIGSVSGLPLESAGLLVVGTHGNYQRAIINHIDDQHDLAVLALVDSNTGQLFMDNLVDEQAINGLEIAKEYLAVGAPVAWAGYPLGNQLLNQLHDPTYSEGVVGIQKRHAGNSKKEIQISGVVVGGYSGSPVIDKVTGRLIGVLANGPENSGIFMAESYEHVEALAKLSRS